MEHAHLSQSLAEIQAQIISIIENVNSSGVGSTQQQCRAIWQIDRQENFSRMRMKMIPVFGDLPQSVIDCICTAADIRKAMQTFGEWGFYLFRIILIVC